MGCATDNVLIEVGQKQQSGILPQNLVSLWLLNLNPSLLQSSSVYLDNQFPNRFSSESTCESDRYTTSSLTMTSSCSVHVWLSATQKLEKRLVETCLYLKNCLYETTYCTSFPSAWGALQQTYPWIGIRLTHCIHSRLDSHSLRLIINAGILHCHWYSRLIWT